MASVSKDARDLFLAARSAYAKSPTRLKIIDMYVVYGVITALIQVVYMAIVGTFPFNAFLSGVLSCMGTSVLGICLRMQVNPANKDFKDVSPESVCRFCFDQPRPSSGHYELLAINKNTMQLKNRYPSQEWMPSKHFAQLLNSMLELI